MSQRAVERALGKLITDEGFREAFFAEPGSASLRAGLELSADEVDALGRVPRDALAWLARCLDGRICRLHVADPPCAGEAAR
jgi:hypothetical protein